jgi:hypothetical protein
MPHMWDLSVAATERGCHGRWKRDRVRARTLTQRAQPHDDAELFGVCVNNGCRHHLACRMGLFRPCRTRHISASLPAAS